MTTVPSSFLKNEGVTLKCALQATFQPGHMMYEKYPLKEFMQRGCRYRKHRRPAIENTDIKREEFEYAAQLCGLSAGEQDGLLKNAAAAAFASDAVKKRNLPLLLTKTAILCV